MSEEELAKVIEKVDVCCRVSPQHKTKIVDAFKAKNHVVAMTGDGVNDAPALKRANIGVCNGHHGDDVTKETADMVLTDDIMQVLSLPTKRGNHLLQYRNLCISSWSAI
jgi:Ca2+-transporting ATPase